MTKIGIDRDELLKLRNRLADHPDEMALKAARWNDLLTMIATGQWQIVIVPENTHRLAGFDANGTAQTETIPTNLPPEA